MSNEAQAFVGEPDGAADSEYEAFYAVLSSSARGRAFLAEHARRSRQADTGMLLAAIERIETMLAEQRAELKSPPPPASPATRVPPSAAAPTALAAIAAQAIAAAESDVPEIKVIKAGDMPPPRPFAGEDFATTDELATENTESAEPDAGSARGAAELSAESNVIAESVPAEHAAPPGTPVADALGAILALSDEERLALFS